MFKNLDSESDTVWDRIKYAYWRIIPYEWRPHQLWYRFKCFVWLRYSTVKSRYLDHTWHDRSTLLPYTMFEILSDFIENECSPGHIEWYGEYGHKIEVDGVEKYVRDEMQELYDWWHQTFQKEYPAVEALLWQEAKKHEPAVEFIPIAEEDEDDDAEELGLSREGWVQWSPQWDNEADGVVWKVCMDALNKLERMADDDLRSKMHRLVNLTPYLWT